MMERFDFVSPPGLGRPPLRLVVDFDTGYLSGPDADQVAKVRALLDEAKAAGFQSIEPVCSAVEITDPYRNRSEFAAVLASVYVLPTNLAAAYPTIPDEGEDDTVY